MDIYARDYISPRQRPLTADEKLTRGIAYGLKTGESGAIRTASVEMALLLAGTGNHILVPVPDSSGDTLANLKLCQAIHALLGDGKAPIADMLRRHAPVVSQCSLRRLGKKLSYSVEQHRMYADPEFCKMLAARCDRDNATLAYVDNVLTTGSTIRACLAAAGIGGDALVFAKSVEIKKPTTGNGGERENYRNADTGQEEGVFEDIQSFCK